ncbi:MAG: hypothetical protein SVY53_06715 [Chloroflexota bacterium]|nr:hypothetical protein [Chloroflexota bacterium]
MIVEWGGKKIGIAGLVSVQIQSSLSSGKVFNGSLTHGGQQVLRTTYQIFK